MNVVAVIIGINNSHIRTIETNGITDTILAESHLFFKHKASITAGY